MVVEGWEPVPARAQLQWPRPSATVPSVLAPANERCALITLHRNFVVANRGRGRTPFAPSSLWSNNDRESVYEGSLREPPRFPVRLGHFQCARAGTGSQPVTVGGTALNSIPCHATDGDAKVARVPVFVEAATP